MSRLDKAAILAASFTIGFLAVAARHRFARTALEYARLPDPADARAEWIRNHQTKEPQ